MEVSKKPSPASEPGPAHIVECTATEDHLDAVHGAMAAFWPGLGAMPDERWRLFFEVAVSEIAANIVEHARPSVVTFSLTAVDGGVVAEFADTGLSWSGPPEPAELLDDFAERGRGLALARTAVDEVIYTRIGAKNQWRLVKRF